MSSSRPFSALLGSMILIRVPRLKINFRYRGIDRFTSLKFDLTSKLLLFSVESQSKL